MSKVFQEQLVFGSRKQIVYSVNYSGLFIGVLNGPDLNGGIVHL